MGKPQVTDVIAAAPFSAAEVIGTAASAEARSEHPLAKRSSITRLRQAWHI